MALTRIEGPSVGNVTANSVTVTSNTVNAATFRAGANAHMNTTTVFVGNSTVNVVISSSGIAASNTVNATTFYAGANVYMNTTAVFVGNSTVNVVISSSSVASSNTVVANGYSTTLVAGESLAALDAVYVEPTLTGGTAGRVYKMDADVLVKSSQAFFAGFALAAASAAASVNIQQSGVVSGFSGLTAGAVYYASSTAGAITATKPLHPIPLGIAISSTQLFINTGIKREEEQRGAVYGYALGGYTGGGVLALATADRVTFSTSTTAAHTAANLPTARYAGSGVSDGTVYGYVLGGYTYYNYIATTDRVTFSTSTTAAHTAANLSQARYGQAGVSDGAVYGYVLGGYTNGDPILATADRVTFSTSTTAAHTAANLSLGRYLTTGLSDAAVYGYSLGGYTGSAAATADRVTFSTSTTAARTAANLSQARYGPAGLSDGAVYGYVLGGYTGGYVATTDRVTFSTSTTAAHTAANLSTARYAVACLSDGAVYGYALGGASGPYVATTDRVTFSTSTTAAHTAANLSGIRGFADGISDGAV